VSNVPVKRVNRGEEDNAVCFIPVKDIEKDSSVIYNKAQVSKLPSWINAHGVAVRDSSVSGAFKYKYGDTFWIYIGAKAEEHQTTVSVINLRTLKEGVIDVGSVCWYPIIQAPNNELWTLGGEIRQLKHGGPKNFSSFSWAICQKLDGTVPTTRNVKIPTKCSTIPDTFQLSSIERRSLFRERYLSMPRESALIASTPGKAQTTPMTPPLSPELDNVESRPVTAVSAQLSQNIGSKYTDVWPGIKELAKASRGVLGPLGGSPIHPRNPPSLSAGQDPRHCPSLLRHSICSEGCRQKGLNEEGSHSSRASCYSGPKIRSPRSEPPFNLELVHLNSPDLVGTNPFEI